MGMIAYRTPLAGLAGLLAVAVTGCGDDPLGGVAEQCGLYCPGDVDDDGVVVEGILEGNASISGIRSVDAFFQSVVTFQTEAKAVTDAVAEITARIDASVADQPGATLEARLRNKIEANVRGSFDVNYAPPRCEASVEVAVEAAARCDAEVNPGSVQVMCMGKCEVEASVMGGCEADATVKCTGTAPSLRCSGSCQGECTFAAQASCEGTCMAGCMGTCTVNMNGASCEGTCRGKCVAGGMVMGGDGNFEGQCDGMCEGTCEPPNAQAECGGSCDGMCMGECVADVEGQCSGSCEGSCEYTPASASCSANAQVSCELEAEAGVMCEGKCEGEVEPPSVKAECQASAKAEAEARVECVPPQLDVKYEFAAGLDAQGQAEFRAWLTGFKAELSALVALNAKADAVFNAGGAVIAAAGAVVPNAVEELKGSASFKVIVGAGCAIDELPKVQMVIDDASTDMMASVEASAGVFAAIAPN